MIAGRASHTLTIRCGCTVYISCHPQTGIAHTRIIERRGQQCRTRSHDVGRRVTDAELSEERVEPRSSEIADGPAAFSRALQLAQAEFMEMPDLQLTEAQAARLWCFDAALCSRVLSTLVDSRFLVRTRKAAYARP